MATIANRERGEIPVRIGDEDLILAASLEGLARVSNEIGARSMRELYDRLVQSDPFAVSVALDCLVIKGDAEKAKDNWTMADMPSWIDAITQTLLMHVDKKKKQGKAPKK